MRLDFTANRKYKICHLHARWCLVMAWGMLQQRCRWVPAVAASPEPRSVLSYPHPPVPLPCVTPKMWVTHMARRGSLPKSWRWQSRSLELRTRLSPGLCPAGCKPGFSCVASQAWQSRVCETLRHINNTWLESISSAPDSLQCSLLRILSVRPLPQSSCPW